MILLWFLWVGIVFLAAVLSFSVLGIDSPVSGAAFFYTCVVAAAIGVILWYTLRRPRDSQTSFYQPVRLLRVNREFLSGKQIAITFGFTSATFADEVLALNSETKKLG
jgi:hypothetical protein